MLFTAWFLFFALLFVFFEAFVSHQFNPNQQVQTLLTEYGQKKVILHSNRFHHYVVTGKLNGEKVTFLIDTGASNVSIPQSLAKKLKLVKGGAVRARTANGVIDVYQTRIASIKIGDINLRNIRASINPNMKSKYILLGMSALRHLDFQQKDGNLILMQQFIKP